MFKFLFGILIGVIGKAVYDLFQEEQMPSGLGINTGRMEALLDETRQIVRDLRGEVQQVLEGARASAQQKAERLTAAATGSQATGQAGPSEAPGASTGPSDSAGSAASGESTASTGTAGTARATPDSRKQASETETA